MNFTILRFDSLGSTNDEAARQAKQGATEGLCVVAGRQTAGRGRRDRAWHSPPDAGLYFSVILRPAFETKKQPLVTLMAAVAVADSVLQTSRLQTDIKWANDVFASGKKLAGILAETADTPIGAAVILGIGINLKETALAPELLEIATSIETETGAAPNVDELLAALTQNLKKYYLILGGANGDEQIIAEWTRRSSYAAGKPVRIRLENETFEGTTAGLQSDGALRVQAENGLIRIVYAGDVVAVRRKE